MNKKEEKRDKKIEIRVTQKEKSDIEKQAQKLGLGVSEYARQFLIKGYVFQPPINGGEKEKNEEANQSFLDKRTLIGLANNLNQLTRYSHENKFLHPKIESLISEIEKYFEV